jgi:hypothetical protein
MYISPTLLLSHRCDTLVRFTQYKYLHLLVPTNTDPIEFYIIRMMTNVHGATKGKSKVGYPNKNAVLLTMLSYGKTAFIWTLSAFSN